MNWFSTDYTINLFYDDLSLIFNFTGNCAGTTTPKIRAETNLHIYWRNCLGRESIRRLENLFRVCKFMDSSIRNFKSNLS